MQTIAESETMQDGPPDRRLDMLRTYLTATDRIHYGSAAEV